MRRRLAAVLAADIVGYSRMVGADETAALGALRDLRANTLRPFTAQHRGDIVKSMGDGWLIVFDSAQDAASCAIKLQDALEGHETIKLRIGVHIGDVTHEEDDIFGDGVNVAARLEALAPQGGVALSQSAFAALDSALSLGFRDAGEQALKNIDTPVRVWLRAPEGAALTSQRISGFPALTVEPVVTIDERAEVADLAEGLTADVSLYLASIQWLEMGEGYRLTQTLRARGDRLRLEARLTDPTGAPMWSGKHDGDLADGFDWQDSVGEAIATQVYGQILGAERARSARTPFEGMTGEQLLLRAIMEFRALTEENVVSALRFGAEAIRRAPSLAQAYAASLTFLFASRTLRYKKAKPYEEMAAQWLDAARPLSAENPVLDMLVGGIDFLSDRDRSNWRARIERALAMSPSNVEVLVFAGWGYTYCGEPHRALDCFTRYRKLGRLCPFWVLGLAGAANASVQAGRDEDAVVFAQKGLELTKDYTALHLAQASASGNLGRRDEAEAARVQVLRLEPEFSVTRFSQTSSLDQTETGQRYLAGLRLAALPE